MIKDLSISVGKTRVAGVLEAEPNSITVKIQAPFGNLKAGEYLSYIGVGFHRYVHNGKLSANAIESGEDLLKGLYLAGRYLQEHPEFIERLQKYLARFEKQARAIQQARKKLLGRFNEGELTQEDYTSQVNEQSLAERRNVMERGSIFRRYAEELAQQSGGRADIDSVLRFNLPEDAAPAGAPRPGAAASGR